MQVLNISAKFVCAFLLYLFSFSASTATAQTLATQDTTSLASLLVKAREFAFNKERVQARNLCREILARDSTYWDAAVLMGRTYIWDDKYDSARVVLNKVVEPVS